MEYDLANPRWHNRIPVLEDILRNVIPIGTEYTNEKEVFVFRPKIFENTKGIIFPNDDIVLLNNSYDIILTNLSSKLGDGFLVLSEIYHEFSVGDVFPVKISGRSRRNQPRFKLYGFMGFINDETLEIGQNVYVKIRRMKEGGEGKYNILETKLYSII